ncbi:MAG: hypothetical protein K9H26_19630 [Prolixibacteraceae bacterium]|nr:hypothetical protein [Prolixibacteraceae bacterium]
MKLFRQTYFPLIEAGIALMIVLLPLSNNPDLMNGIQTAKSFNIFHKILFNKEIEVHSKAIEEIKEEMKQIKERETTMNNTSLLIKHQFW